jgi:hypothetical protein
MKYFLSKGVQRRLQDIASHYNFKKFLEDSNNKLELMDKLSRNASEFYFMMK